MDLHEARASIPIACAALGSLVGAGLRQVRGADAAAFRGGVFLRVPRGVAVEKPIHVDQRFGGGAFEATRLLVVVEEGASVTIVDELAGGPDDGTASSSASPS